MTWIKETAWPWLKANWQWVLFPIGLALFILRMTSRGPQVQIIDPTEKADERARIEEETRTRQVEAERQRLAAEETAIQARADTARKATEAAQAAEVQQLREDPEALRDRMLRAGKP